MSLHSEIEESLVLWRKLSLFKRILLSISIFISVSSITSLSDYIFKWKGFILDGLNFYRDYITLPLQNILSLLNIPLTQLGLDIIIVMMLGLTAQSQIYTIPKNKLKIAILFLSLYRFIVFISLTLFLSLSSNIFNHLVMLVVLIFFILYHPIKKKYTVKEKKKYYLPIFIAFSGVIILAAINIGLTRTI